MILLILWQLLLIVSVFRCLCRCLCFFVFSSRKKSEILFSISWDFRSQDQLMLSFFRFFRFFLMFCLFLRFFWVSYFFRLAFSSRFWTIIAIRSLFFDFVFFSKISQRESYASFHFSINLKKKVWNIFRTSERFKFDSENCWNLFNTDMNQTKNLCLLVSQCRIAIESDCVFRASSTIWSADEIIEKSANAAKTRTRCASRYVFEFSSIFFSLIIYNCFNSLFSRSWTFDEIRTLFWSLTVRSTIAITQSISFFVFAIFVVALRCEKIIDDTSQTVQFINKEENQKFSSNSDMFSRNCHVLSVTDLLNELVHLFFFVWRKEWKRFSFSKINDDWWWFDFFFDEFFFFCFCDFVIFFFF